MPEAWLRHDPLPALKQDDERLAERGEREKRALSPNSPCAKYLRTDLSPRLCATAYSCRRLPATGRRYQHPTWQAIGAWKAGLVWRDLVQEARSDRCGAVKNARPPAAAMSSCAVVVLPGQPEHGQAAKARTGTQIAARGCRKATPGTVRSHGEPGQALEEVSRPPGAGETAPRLPSTAPASRLYC